MLITFFFLLLTGLQSTKTVQAATFCTDEETLFSFHAQNNVQAFKFFLFEKQKTLSPHDFKRLINTVDENKNTLLISLIQNHLEQKSLESLAMLETFISFKPSPHVGKQGPLHTVINYYCKHYLDYKNDCYGVDPILQSCSQILSLLKKIGQDFNEKNSLGQTSLDILMQLFLLDQYFETIPHMIELLLEHGTNPRLSARTDVNPDAWSAVDLAYLSATDPKSTIIYNVFSTYKFYASRGAIAEYYYSQWIRSSACTLL